MTTPHEKISTEIEKIVATRNPFSILFSLGRVAEILRQVDDELIDGIERTFTDSTQESYKKVLSAYKKDGFFTYLSSWAVGSGMVQQYRRELDRYFDDSFYFDLDFFFFCLRQDKTWGAAMILLVKLAKDSSLRQAYFESPVTTRHDWICNHYTPARNLPDGIRREVTVIVNNLAEGEIPLPAANLQEQDEESAATLCREIAFLALRDNPKGKRAKFLLERAANTPAVNRRLIDALPDASVIKVLTYLRRGSKLISASEKSEYWQNDKKIEGFVRHARIIRGRRDLRALLALENHIRKYRANRDFFFAKFRYKFLNREHGGLLDIVFGVPSLPRDEFYQLKRRTDGADPSDFGVLRQVKDLVIYLQKNWLTQFLLPFFLRRLARRFNAGNANYWLVKFVLAMVLPQGYSEYRQVIAFYSKLEAHWTPGWRGIALRSAQFGWIIFAGIVAFMLFPAGMLAAVAILILTANADRIIERCWPQLHANLNFQIRATAVCIGVFALVMGATVGLKDNLSLAYRNFQGAINAITLPASETLALLGNQMRQSQANILEADQENIPRFGLNDVDYLEGKNLSDLQKNGVTKKTPSSTTNNGVITDSPKTASSFVVKPGSTFWDNAVRIAKNCQKDTSTKTGERALYFALKSFLESNRARLVELARAPKNTRIPAMELPRYLPAGTTWDEQELSRFVCQ